MAQNPEVAPVIGIFSKQEVMTEPLLTKEYATAMTPGIYDSILELGLEPEFAAIAGRHIQDLYIGIDTRPKESKTSSLTVMKSQNYPTCEYVRAAIIGMHDVEVRRRAISNSCAKQGIKPDKIAVSKTAFDWVFFELCFDAVNNACRMQQKYGKYVRDYNGQNIYDEAHLTISRAFMEEYAADFTKNDLITEYELTKAGFALQLLKDTFVRNNIVSNNTRAEWLVTKLAKNHSNTKSKGIPPYRQDELMLRLTNIRPAQDVTAEWAKFFGRFIGFDTEC